MNQLKDGEILSILEEYAYITPEDAQSAEQYAKQRRSSPISFLLSENLVNNDLLGQAIAEHYDVPYVDLNSIELKEDTKKCLPSDFVTSFRVIPYLCDGTTINVATDNPKNSDMLLALDEIIGDKKVNIHYSLSEDIDRVLLSYRSRLSERLDAIIASGKEIIPSLIREIFKEGSQLKASDIHIEPLEDIVVIRFRIDGVLTEVGTLNKDLYTNFVNGIKLVSQLRIDEHDSMQDGAIRYNLEGIQFDMRVSIVPTLNGEKVVIRILSQYVRDYSLTDIGLSEHHRALIEDAAKKPFGMILVVGPTGSGKSTTLYSLLKLLNSPEVNITTIEDPVEYRIKGINQIQVNDEKDITFATGLRSIVRQDPDIILVGEIRDKETANIAVNASLTGHLLLSTLHANNAPTTIPRLIEMGAEPFLLATTIELMISQRLVRKTCESCRKSKHIKTKTLIRKYPEVKDFIDTEEITIYEGSGCSMCNNSGYSGRIAIFEIIKMTDEIREIINATPSARAIWDVAVSQGSTSLFADGVSKALSGITTIEEVLRIAPPIDD